jgi:hypothetical protein
MYEYELNKDIRYKITLEAEGRARRKGLNPILVPLGFFFIYSSASNVSSDDQYSSTEEERRSAQQLRRNMLHILMTTTDCCQRELHKFQPQPNHQICNRNEGDSDVSCDLCVQCTLKPVDIDVTRDARAVFIAVLETKGVLNPIRIALFLTKAPTLEKRCKNYQSCFEKSLSLSSSCGILSHASYNLIYLLNLKLINANYLD